jgi:hypothetical protein
VVEGNGKRTDLAHLGVSTFTGISSLLHRSTRYCNAQLVYYTLVESWRKEVHGSSGCREQAKSMIKHRKTVIEAVAYLHTSSAKPFPPSPACPVRPKSRHSANAAFMSTPPNAASHVK